MIKPLRELTASSHPLGDEVRLQWLLPFSHYLPTNYRVMVFKREGTEVPQKQVDDYFLANVTADGLSVMTDIPQGFTYARDLDAENGQQYAYKAVVQDTDTKDYSTPLSVTCMPTNISQIKIIDCKALVVEAIERLMISQNVIPHKDIEVRKTLSLANANPPVVAVVRAPGSIYQEFIGQLMTYSEAASEWGDVELDNISVVWECLHEERRNILTNLFRGAKRSIIKFLANRDVMGTRIIIGGDGVDERWQEGTLFTCNMTVQCVIESKIVYKPIEEKRWPVDLEQIPWQD